MKRAVVVGDGKLHVDAALGALTTAGFEAVAVGSVTEARAQVEGGAVVAIVAVTASPWEGERSLPFVTMPSPLRRAAVLVLVGDGLPTGDGTKSFLLGADLVVGSADLSRLGALVGAALTAKRTLVGALDPTAAGRLGV